MIDSTLVDFKTQHHIVQRNEASVVLGAKSVRAVFDRNIGDGGGWRCPPGTANAGQWSDRFGRNCGGPAASRRIGNAVGNVARRVTGEKPKRRGVAGRTVARAEAARRREARGALFSEARPARRVREPAPQRQSQVDRDARIDRFLERLRTSRLEARKPEEQAKPEVSRPNQRPGVVRRPNKPVRRVDSRGRPILENPGVKPPPARKRPARDVERRQRRDARVPQMAELNDEQRRNAMFNALDTRKRLQKRWMKRLGVNEFDPFSNDDRQRVEAVVRGADAGARDRLAEEARDLFNLVDYGLVGGVDRMSPARRRRMFEPRDDANEDMELGILPNEFNELFPKVIPEEDKALVHVGSDRPRVTSLKIAEFDKRRRDEMDAEQIANLGRIAALRDEWDTVEGATRARDENQRLWREKREARDNAHALLRDMDWVKANPEAVKDVQAAYALNASLMSQHTISGFDFEERVKLVSDFNSINGWLNLAANERRNLEDRERYLAKAEDMLKARRKDKPKGHAGLDFDERLEDADGFLASARDLLEEDKLRIEGPRDREGILAEGGPQLRAKQKKLDEIIEAARNDEAKREAAAEWMNRLQKEREELGPEVRGEVDATERQRNIRRRWLDHNIRDLRDASNTFEGMASIYTHKPQSRPEVLGVINDQNGARTIVNPNIKTVADAVKFVRDGGRLDEVPNEFWGKTLLGNSSQIADDPTTRFFNAPKKGGIIGETKIFVARNPDGTPGRAGYVLKASNSSDNMGEVMSQELMKTHGLPVGGAGWDGELERGDQAVILPHAANLLPEGDAKLGRGAENYHIPFLEDQENGAYPQRLQGLVHNWLMSVTDRHYQNGFTIRIGNETFVIPFDQGWAGANTSHSLPEYADRYYDMDRMLPGKMKASINNEAHARQVVAMYDDLLARAEKNLDGGFEALYEKIAPPGGGDAGDRQRAESLWKIYTSRVESMRNGRDLNLASMLPDRFMGVI